MSAYFVLIHVVTYSRKHGSNVPDAAILHQYHNIIVNYHNM